MNRSNLPTFALLVGALALPAFATAQPAASTAELLAARAEAAASLHRPTGTDAAPQAKVMGTTTRAGTPKANPLRAYPPSCAAAPLPDKASGPTVSKRVQLWKTNYQGTVNLREDVTVTVWRLPCSSSGAATRYNPDGSPNALTLMRIDRDADVDGKDNAFPTMPYVQASQNGATMDDFKSLVRTPIEPNTVVSEASYNTPVIKSTTFVLENYALPDVKYFTFNDAFKLRINPVLGVAALVDIDVPAYAPTAQDYPAAFEPRELDGYTAAQWINSELNQGLLLQVTEQLQADASTVRQVVFDLLLEDNNGNPLWLIGNAAFPLGAKTLDIDLAYLGNGLALIPWGTAKLEVADCNHVEVTYAGTPQTDTSIPVFNGLTEYERLFAPNGMVCE